MIHLPYFRFAAKNCLTPLYNNILIIARKKQIKFIFVVRQESDVNKRMLEELLADICYTNSNIRSVFNKYLYIILNIYTKYSKIRAFFVDYILAWYYNVITVIDR